MFAWYVSSPADPMHLAKKTQIAVASASQRYESRLQQGKGRRKLIRNGSYDLPLTDTMKVDTHRLEQPKINVVARQSVQCFPCIEVNTQELYRLPECFSLSDADLDASLLSVIRQYRTSSKEVLDWQNR